MAEKRGIGVKHNLKFDVKSGSNEEFQGSNAKQDVEEIEFGRNSIVKSDRGVKQLKVDVKSGSGETSKRLIAKDDVKALSFRCYSSRTGHHASGLRGYTSYVASFFNCCNVFRRKGDDGTFDGPVVGSVIFPGSHQEHVSTFNHDNEFGRNTNTPQLFRTVGPFDPVYGPVGEAPCYGSGTGRRNQPVSTSSNHAKMNYSDDSNKTKGLTVVPRANETPIVVEKEKDVEKGVPRQWLKKWLCLGWFANKQRNL